MKHLVLTTRSKQYFQFADPFGIPLSIITTDYTNYAIMYGCKVNPELNLKYGEHKNICISSIVMGV